MAPAHKPKLQRKKFKSAAQFLGALSPDNLTFKKYLPQSLVFRGLGCADYPLLPSAFRTQSFAPFFQERDKYHVDFRMPIPRKTTLAWELELLLAFIESANAQGIELPGYSHALHESLWDDCWAARTLKDTKAIWPKQDYWAVIALAQHHGIPTRFLDWSFDPLIAAYFAASRGIDQRDRELERRKCDPKGRKGCASEVLAVWVLRKSVDDFDRALVTHGYERFIHYVSAPGASNRNLVAQKGLFTFLADWEEKGPYERLPLDQALLKIPEFYESYHGLPDPLMWKLELPWTEAPELLRLLARQNVSAATVFPGLGGIAASLKERELWSQPHGLWITKPILTGPPS